MLELRDLSLTFVRWSSPESDKSNTVVEYMLTAGAIGMLFKKGASISAAEVGCQGEIGVACSMAAAGLCALYGGSPRQVSRLA
jgi:L-serine dehydratase